MKKLLIVALTVFAFAFVLGSMTPDNANAGPTKCYYKCTCEGIALKCCVTNGVETCGLAKGMQCLDVYPC